MSLRRDIEKVGSTIRPADLTNVKLRYDVKNLQGIGARPYQEDSFTIINGISEEQYDKFGMLLAVCDGMGGMKGGREASMSVVSDLRSFFPQMNRASGIPGQLDDVLIKASDNIYGMLDGLGGSTAVVCIVIYEQLYFSSVGDSFLWLYRDGELIRLNREHNVRTDILFESIQCGDLDPHAADGNDEPAALTSFLGMPEITQIDHFEEPLRLRRGDTLLLCSDGVGGTLTEDEVKDALGYPQSVSGCDLIEKYIREHAKPNQDNYTAILLKCN